MHMDVILQEEQLHLRVYFTQRWLMQGVLIAANDTFANHLGIGVYL